MKKSAIYELAIACVIDAKELQTMTKTEIIDVLSQRMHDERILEKYETPTEGGGGLCEYQISTTTIK